MKKLEDQLQVDLWYRDGRKLKPSEAGRYLLQTALRLIPQMEQCEERLEQFGRGERGTFKIGMECHPCYQWLLKILEPFLRAWPAVNPDVRQKFLFGGLGALFNHEIDLLITPDPLFKPGIHYEAVFDYEAVIAVGAHHPFRELPYILPQHLSTETLYTYPVETQRLDIFTRFLIPAGLEPRKHIPIETTEIMLQMVACGRGVAALPRWIIEENAYAYSVYPLQLGQEGTAKQIYLAYREEDASIDYLQGFLELAQNFRKASGKKVQG